MAGAISGVSILATELDGKRQDILIEAVSGIHRMAVVLPFGRASESTNPSPTCRIFRDQLRVLPQLMLRWNRRGPPKNTVIDREVLAVNKAAASQIVHKKHHQRVLPREGK